MYIYIITTKLDFLFAQNYRINHLDYSSLYITSGTSTIERGTAEYMTLWGRSCKGSSLVIKSWKRSIFFSCSPRADYIFRCWFFMYGIPLTINVWSVGNFNLGIAGGFLTDILWNSCSVLRYAVYTVNALNVSWELRFYYLNRALSYYSELATYKFILQK